MFFSKLSASLSNFISGQAFTPWTDINLWGYIFNPIGQFLARTAVAVISLFYWICKWLLAVIDFLQYFLQRLIGLDYWLKSGPKTMSAAVKNDILFSFLYNDTIQRVFRAMVGIFIVLLIIFTIYAIIKQEWKFATGASFGTKAENSKSTIIRNSMKAIAIVLIFPLILTVGIISSNAILASLVKALSGGNDSFGNQLFSIAAQGANKYRIYATENKRRPITQKVTFTVNGNGRSYDQTIISLGSGMTYLGSGGYLATAASGKTFTVDTMFEPVVPQDVHNGFSGFCISLQVNGKTQYFLVNCDVDDDGSVDADTKWGMYYYLDKILGAKIMTSSNDIGASDIQSEIGRSKIAGDAGNGGNPPGYINKYKLKECPRWFAEKCCYTTWGYNSVYIETSLDFESSERSVKVTSGDLTGLGFVGLSGSAKKIYNSDLFARYFDGGQTGLNPLQAEYYVNADVVDFICEQGVTLYVLDITSPEIDWSNVSKKYVSLREDGSKTLLNLNYKQNNEERSDYLKDTAAFVCSYSEQCLDMESGNVLYLASNGKYDEFQGSKFIYCWKAKDASGHAKYIPLQNGKIYNDDENNSKYSFKSAYYSSNYEGVVLARGVFDTSSENGWTGEPTYIKSSYAIDDKHATVISEKQPYYYDIVSVGGISHNVDAAGGAPTLVADVDAVAPNQFILSENYSTYEVVKSSTNLYKLKNNVGDFVRFENIDLITSGLTIKIGGDYATYAGSNLTNADDSVDFLFATSGGKYFGLHISPDKTSASLLSIGTDGNLSLSNVSDSITLLKISYTINFAIVGGDLGSINSGSSETLTPSEFIALGDGKFRTLDKMFITCKKTVGGEDQFKTYKYKPEFSADSKFTSGLVQFDSGTGKVAFANLTGTGTGTGVTVYQVKFYNYFSGTVGSDLKQWKKGETGLIDATPIEDVEDFTFVVSGIYSWSTDSLIQSSISDGSDIIVFYKSADKSGHDSPETGDEVKFNWKEASGSIHVGYLSFQQLIDRILINYDTYYNIRTQNQFSSASDMKGYYDRLSNSFVTNFYRDASTSKLKGDWQFWPLTKMRYKLCLGVGYINHDYTVDTSLFGGNSGGITLSDGIRFDYFFDYNIELGVFYAPQKIAYWILLIATALIIKVLGNAIWGAIKRFYEITLYFLAMPAMASMYPIDNDGGRFKSSIIQPLIGKILSVYGVILGLNFFFVLLRPIKTISKVFTAEDIVTSGSYFLKHLPGTPQFAADCLNNYVYILFVLVAFTMIETLPGVISNMLSTGTGAQVGEIGKEGAETKSKAVQQVKSAGDVISGRSAIEGAGKAVGMVTRSLPLGAAAGWAGKKVGGLVQKHYADRKAGEQKGEERLKEQEEEAAAAQQQKASRIDDEGLDEETLENGGGVPTGTGESSGVSGAQTGGQGEEKTGSNDGGQQVDGGATVDNAITDAIDSMGNESDAGAGTGVGGMPQPGVPNPYAADYQTGAVAYGATGETGGQGAAGTAGAQGADGKVDTEAAAQAGAEAGARAGAEAAQRALAGQNEAENGAFTGKQGVQGAGAAILGGGAGVPDGATMDNARQIQSAMEQEHRERYDDARKEFESLSEKDQNGLIIDQIRSGEKDQSTILGPETQIARKLVSNEGYDNTSVGDVVDTTTKRQMLKQVAGNAADFDNMSDGELQNYDVVVDNDPKNAGHMRARALRKGEDGSPEYIGTMKESEAGFADISHALIQGAKDEDLIGAYQKAGKMTKDTYRDGAIYDLSGLGTEKSELDNQFEALPDEAKKELAVEMAFAGAAPISASGAAETAEQIGVPFTTEQVANLENEIKTGTLEESYKAKVSRKSGKQIDKEFSSLTEEQLSESEKRIDVQRAIVGSVLENTSELDDEQITKSFSELTDEQRTIASENVDVRRAIVTGTYLNTLTSKTQEQIDKEYEELRTGNEGEYLTYSASAIENVVAGDETGEKTHMLHVAAIAAHGGTSYEEAEEAFGDGDLASEFGTMDTASKLESLNVLKTTAENAEAAEKAQTAGQAETAGTAQPEAEDRAAQIERMKAFNEANRDNEVKELTADLSAGLYGHVRDYAEIDIESYQKYLNGREDSDFERASYFIDERNSSLDSNEAHKAFVQKLRKAQGEDVDSSSETTQTETAETAEQTENAETATAGAGRQTGAQNAGASAQIVSNEDAEDTRKALSEAVQEMTHKKSAEEAYNEQAEKVDYTSADSMKSTILGSQIFDKAMADERVKADATLRMIGSLDDADMQRQILDELAIEDIASLQDPKEREQAIARIESFRQSTGINAIKQLDSKVASDSALAEKFNNTMAQTIKDDVEAGSFDASAWQFADGETRRQFAADKEARDRFISNGLLSGASDEDSASIVSTIADNAMAADKSGKLTRAIQRAAVENAYGTLRLSASVLSDPRQLAVLYAGLTDAQKAAGVEKSGFKNVLLHATASQVEKYGIGGSSLLTGINNEQDIVIRNASHEARLTEEEKRFDAFQSRQAAENDSEAVMRAFANSNIEGKSDTIDLFIAEKYGIDAADSKGLASKKAEILGVDVKDVDGSDAQNAQILSRMQEKDKTIATAFVGKLTSDERQQSVDSLAENGFASFDKHGQTMIAASLGMSEKQAESFAKTLSFSQLKGLSEGKTLEQVNKEIKENTEIERQSELIMKTQGHLVSSSSMMAQIATDASQGNTDARDFVVGAIVDNIDILSEREKETARKTAIKAHLIETGLAKEEDLSDKNYQRTLNELVTSGKVSTADLDDVSDKAIAFANKRKYAASLNTGSESENKVLLTSAILSDDLLGDKAHEVYAKLHKGANLDEASDEDRQEFLTGGEFYKSLSKSEKKDFDKIKTDLHKDGNSNVLVDYEAAVMDNSALRKKAEIMFKQQTGKNLADVDYMTRQHFLMSKDFYATLSTSEQKKVDTYKEEYIHSAMGDLPADSTVDEKTIDEYIFSRTTVEAFEGIYESSKLENMGEEPDVFTDAKKKVVKDKLAKGEITPAVDTSSMTKEELRDFNFNKNVLQKQIMADGDGSVVLANIFKNSTFVNNDELLREMGYDGKTDADKQAFISKLSPDKIGGMLKQHEELKDQLIGFAAKDMSLTLDKDAAENKKLEILSRSGKYANEIMSNIDVTKLSQSSDLSDLMMSGMIKDDKSRQDLISELQTRKQNGRTKYGKVGLNLLRILNDNSLTPDQMIQKIQEQKGMDEIYKQLTESGNGAGQSLVNGFAQNNKEYIFKGLDKNKYRKEILAASEKAEKASDVFASAFEKDFNSSIDPSKVASDKAKEEYLANEEIRRANGDKPSKVVEAFDEFDRNKDGFVSRVFHKFSNRLPEHSKKYDNWNSLIDRQIREAKKGSGEYAKLSRTEREQAIKELESKKIVYERPENFASMTVEEQNHWEEQQKLYRQEAYTTNNYSQIYNNFVRAVVPTATASKAFAKAYGTEFDNASASKDADRKSKHMQKLLETKSRIERYNASKPMRNTELDFGSNFNNFAQSYFNKTEFKFLQSELALKLTAKGIDIDTPYEQLDAKQQAIVRQVREETFAKKLNKTHVTAAKKVAKDNKVSAETYLAEKGVDVGDKVRYKDATKKLLDSPHPVRRLLDKKERARARVDRARKAYEEEYKKTDGKFDTESAKKAKARYEKTAEWQQSAEGQARIKFENPEKTISEMQDFINSYKGPAKKFAEEFKKKFGSQAQQIYADAEKSIRTAFKSMEDQSISSQRDWILMQMRNEVKKFNNRNKFGLGSYIPASSEAQKQFVGKTLTGATSRAEVKAHQDHAEMISQALKVFNNQKAYLSAVQLKDNVLSNAILRDAFARQHMKEFEKADDAGRKQLLEKFLKAQLSKANDVVRKDTYLQADKYKLTKLNGVSIQRSRMEQRTSRTVTSALSAIDRTVYNNLVREQHSVQAKYTAEQANQDRIRERLFMLRAMRYKDAKTRQEISKLETALDDSKISMARLERLMKKIMAQKTDMEKRVLENIKPKTPSNIVYRQAENKPVTSRYQFRYGKGENAGQAVKPGTADAAQVDKIVSDYMKKFNGQVDKMFNSRLAQQSAEFKKAIGKIRDQINNDFKKSVDLTKATRKELDKLIQYYKSQSDKKSQDIVVRLTEYSAILDKSKTEMQNRFKAMDIDLKQIKEL